MNITRREDDDPRITPEVCEQCNGTGQLRGGIRCGCKEEDDEAEERRKKMGIIGGRRWER